MKRTQAQLAVAHVLLEEPGGKHWGTELANKTGVPRPAVYQMLARWNAAGLLSAGWGGWPMSGPVRHYYRLTAQGRRELTEFVKPREKA